MARPKKARVEGAASKQIQPIPDEAEIGVIEEPAAEPSPPDPVPGDNGEALDRIAAFFREKHPEDWENIRLCPLQHGLPHMADLLRARG